MGILSFGAIVPIDIVGIEREVGAKKLAREEKGHKEFLADLAVSAYSRREMEQCQAEISALEAQLSSEGKAARIDFYAEKIRKEEANLERRLEVYKKRLAFIL
jgi:Zn-dependent oligopeptidase